MGYPGNGQQQSTFDPVHDYGCHWPRRSDPVQIRGAGASRRGAGAGALRRIQQEVVGDGYADRALPDVAFARIVGRAGLLGVGSHWRGLCVLRVSPAGEDRKWTNDGPVDSAK